MTCICTECEGRGVHGPRFPEMWERAEDFKCPRCDGSGRIADNLTGQAIRRLFMADEAGIRWVAGLWSNEPVFQASSRPGG